VIRKPKSQGRDMGHPGYWDQIGSSMIYGLRLACGLGIKVDIGEGCGEAVGARPVLPLVALRRGGAVAAAADALLRAELFLYGCDGVLRDLGDAELDHGLGLDLDGLAGLGVATEASLALSLDELADAGDGELAVLLGFLDGGLSERFEESGGLLVGELELLCEQADERCLCHSLCHCVSPSF
jgi:hypothetical protein